MHATRITRSLHTLSLMMVGAVTTSTIGCADATIPVSLDLPGFTLDLDAQRTALEQIVCANVGDIDCGILTDLDATDGKVASPPTLPELLPVMLETSPSKFVNVPEWFASVQERATAEVEAALDDELWMRPTLLPITFDASALDALSDDQLGGLEIQQARIVFESNSLSVNVPAIDVTIGNGLTTAEDGTVSASDRASALLAAQCAGKAAGVDGEADVSFAQGAVVGLADVLRGEQPWVEFKPSEDVVGLLPGDVAATLRRPGGAVQLKLELRIGVPVSVGTLVQYSQ
jgi:hypothetical protein